MAKKSKQKDTSSTDKAKESKDPQANNSPQIKSKRAYIVWGIIAVIVVISILILALTGEKEINQAYESNEEIQQEEIISPQLANYDLSTYANNPTEHVGTQTTLSGYLKWEQVETGTNSIANNYRLVDSLGNEIPLAFAGLSSDFSQFEQYFIKGEISTQAYDVQGKFEKTFSNTKFEVKSINPVN